MEPRRFVYRYSFLLSVLFPYYYILAQYELPLFTVGVWLLIVLTLVECIRLKYIMLNKYMLIFFIYTFMIQLIFHSKDSTLNIIGSMFFSLFFISGLSYKMDFDVLYKSYKYIGIVVSLIIVFQYIQIFIFGRSIRPSISLFPTLTTGVMEWERYLDRPCSLFSEPQAYASYILPLVVMALSKKEIKFSIFLTLSVILSTSSQGIIIVIILWTMYGNKYIKGLFSKILVYIFIALNCFMFFMLPYFEFTRDKILSTDFSNNVRISRGFKTYFALPLYEKLFGVGYLNQQGYLTNARIYLEWFNLSIIKEFITTASGVFVYFGFLSGVLLILLLIRYYRNGDNKAKMFCIVIVISMFSQAILYNAWFNFYLIFAFNLLERNNTKDVWILRF